MPKRLMILIAAAMLASANSAINTEAQATQFHRRSVADCTGPIIQGYAVGPEGGYKGLFLEPVPPESPLDNARNPVPERIKGWIQCR